MTWPNEDRRNGPTNEDIMRALGALEAGQKETHRKQDKTNGRMEKAEVRINKVERRQSWFMGGLATLGVVITGALSLFK